MTSRLSWRSARIALVALAAMLAAAERPVRLDAQPPAAPIEYTLSFPEPQHRWMQVEAVFGALGDAPLRVRMSRSSPGRYALHEFAKNVYDMQFEDGRGRSLDAARPSQHEWEVAGHDGTVKARYRVFGDRVDGTYLAIDSTHAHINMPAALLWSESLQDRPARVTFRQPEGASWRVATQLLPTGDPLVFTAPNLQYLMDSPAEFSAFTLREFPAPPGSGTPPIRIALHHLGSDADADAFARDVGLIVEQAHRLFGEYPAFEGGAYTFLADYLPWASGDGMEHRNSTVLTGPISLSSGRLRALGTVAHEFLHVWNVERIRPASLEPFDFARANVTGELWLAEGVTSYYDDVLLARAGLIDFPELLSRLSSTVETVMRSPATQFRSAEDMSRMAPFVDAASWIDRTNWQNTYISYYTFGAAIGFGFDLAIRERTNGRASLDDFMRAMWRAHGRPGGTRPGYVDRPYTIDDVEARLAEVIGDAAFARELLSRHVRGREVIDYERLVRQAGLVLRPRTPGRASLGPLEIERAPDGIRVAGPAVIGSAAYRAGLGEGDVITSIDGDAVGTPEQLDAALRGRAPGSTVTIGWRRRGGETARAEVVLDQDPAVAIVPVESTGGTPTEAQRAVRRAWVGTER